MIMNSFKTGSEIINAPNALPKNFSFNGYIQAFYSLNLGRIFLNTLFISVTVTLVNTLLSAMVAYAIVKMNLPGREFWIKLILTSMMVPAVLFTIPTYMMLYSWGWVNTFQALIVPGTISAYNIFLLVQFLKQVDNAYLEAARIDGAGEFTIFQGGVADDPACSCHCRDPHIYGVMERLYGAAVVCPRRFTDDITTGAVQVC